MEWQILMPNLFCWAAAPLAAAIFFCRYWRGGWPNAAAAVILAGAVLNVCSAAAHTVCLWFISTVHPASAALFLSGDTLREAFRVLLAAVLLVLIDKYFRQSLAQLTWPAVFLLSVPIVYISLAEHTVRRTVYSDTMVIDSELGLIYPAVNHKKMLFLQLLACLCLFLTLAAYQKITQAARAQQTIQLLRQQSQVQDTYIREAQSRYEQTRSFRHDVQNHLTVLAELLHTGQTAAASAYLSRLEATAEELSFPIHTGRAAVDALLSSKLAAARQKEIDITCEIKLPNSGGVSDIDWCIVLSNAIDNAVRASISEKRRFIHITGKMQGNLYLLSVENSCARTLAGVPEEGIGLGNIRAAAEKHQGTVQLTAEDGVFRLDVLLVISHPAEDTSQQSP